jgi:hypothetical protein
MATVSERLFDADVRIEKLFWTEALCADAPSDFEEFVEDELYDEDDLMATLPFLHDGESAEDVLSELSFHNHHGFFIQLASPIPSRIKRGSYCSSWGHYRTKWLFLRNLGDVAFAAEKFREEVMAEAKARESEGA